MAEDIVLCSEHLGVDQHLVEHIIVLVGSPNARPM